MNGWMIVDSRTINRSAVVGPRTSVAWPLLLVALLALLAPSAYFAWNNRTMPQLGSYHDDAVYWIPAQSIPAGHGYHIDHLPEIPEQTKYPPLYPLLLSLVRTPAAATLLQWSFAPVYLILAWMYFRRCG